MPEEDVVEDLQMRLFWEEALFGSESPGGFKMSGESQVDRPVDRWGS